MSCYKASYTGRHQYDRPPREPSALLAPELRAAPGWLAFLHLLIACGLSGIRLIIRDTYAGLKERFIPAGLFGSGFRCRASSGWIRG